MTVVGDSSSSESTTITSVGLVATFAGRLDFTLEPTTLFPNVGEFCTFLTNRLADTEEVEVVEFVVTGLRRIDLIMEPATLFPDVDEFWTYPTERLADNDEDDVVEFAVTVGCDAAGVLCKASCFIMLQPFCLPSELCMPVRHTASCRNHSDSTPGVPLCAWHG